jgi:hypothetical protein
MNVSKCKGRMTVRKERKVFFDSQNFAPFAQDFVFFAVTGFLITHVT